MTRLECFNKYFFQFTFFRINRIGKFQDEEYKVFTQDGWGLMGPVMPYSGWGKPYKGWPKTWFSFKCKERTVYFD